MEWPKDEYDNNKPIYMQLSETVKLKLNKEQLQVRAKSSLFEFCRAQLNSMKSSSSTSKSKVKIV